MGQNCKGPDIIVFILELSGQYSAPWTDFLDIRLKD